MHLQFFFVVALSVLITRSAATITPPIGTGFLFTNTGVMKILFDTPTDQGKVYAPRPCRELLLVNVTDFEKHMCRFTDDQTLYIDAPYTSNWDENTKYYYIPSKIARKDNGVNITDTAFKLLNKQSFSAPPPRITGPSIINRCAESIVYQIDAQFGAGRRWRLATVISSTPPLVTNPVVDRDTLSFALTPSMIVSGFTYSLTATLINGFGESLTSPTFVLTVQSLVNKLAIPVMVRGGSSTRTYKTSDEIRLQSFAQVARACVDQLPAGTLIQDWTISYNWSIVSIPTETTAFLLGTPIIGLTSDKSEAVIPPNRLKPKVGAEFAYYRARIEVRSPQLSSIAAQLDVLGSAEIVIAIKHADPVFVIDVPSWVDNSTNLLVDYRKSCILGVTPDCLPFVGRKNLTGNGGIIFNTVELQIWTGTIFDKSVLNTEYEDPPNINDGFWEIGRPGVGLYRLEIAATRADYSGELFRIYRQIEIGRLSRFESATCFTSKFSLPVFATKGITIQDREFPKITSPPDVPLIIRAAGVPMTSSANWTMRNFLGRDQFSFENIPSTLSPFTNRPSLSLSGSLLYPGYLYTFRLSVRAVGCAPGTGGTAESQVSFSINVPPKNGIVVVKPNIGIGFSTIFSVQTGGWGVEDTLSQLPLQYEFQFLRAGTRSTITLASLSAAPFLFTRLASPRQKCRDEDQDQQQLAQRLASTSFVIVVCKDALGSASRVSTNNFTVNPMYLAGAPILGLPRAQDEIGNVIRLGGSAEDQVRTLAILSDEAATTECIGQNLPLADQVALAVYRQSVTRVTLGLVSQARGFFRLAGRPPSLSEMSLLVYTFASAMSGAFNKFVEVDLTAASTLLTGVLQDVQDAYQANPSNGPAAFEFAQVFLDVLSGLGKSLQYTRSEKEGLNPIETIGRDIRSLAHIGGHGRNLQQRGGVCTWECQVQKGLQNALRKLIGLLLTNFEPGTEARIVKGIDIEIKCSREFRDSLGQDNGVNRLQFDDGLQFKLPPNLLQDPSRIRNISVVGPVPDSIDVCAIRFRFNPLELAKEANLPPGVDINRRIIKRGVIVPNFTIQEVNTLLFLNQIDPNTNYDPFNLTTKINITIPLPADYVAPTNTSQELACGFFDDSFEGWSADGCTAIEINIAQKYVICSCNHASDFAAWNAFLANLGGGDVGVVATIAIIVVSCLLPGILLAWLVAFLWARNKDDEDSRAVHLGALIILTKNRVRLNQRQRRFFRALRENAKRPAGELSATKKPIPPISDTKAAFNAMTDAAGRCCWNRFSLINMWLQALYYEHSFFGIFTRFDPNYTRTQRVTVLTAVLVGNLFAASFFFDFKTATDLSAGVLIASVLIAALLVALPIKMAVRWLFRATEQQIGSPMHIVAEIYRISEFQSGDLLPAYANETECADSQMLFAFKDYYAAQTNVVALKMVLDQMDSRKSKRSSCCCSKKELRETSIELQKKTLHSRLGLKVNEDGQIDRMELEKSLRVSEERSKKLLEVLKRACLQSKEEWSKVPTLPNIRVETLRRQQSNIMKFASLLYDETETRAKSRQKYLKSWFIYVAWAILFVYLLGGLGYCARWVLGRTSYKSTVDPISTDAELESDANGVIVAWLLSAGVGVVIGVFLSEPVIQFIRFSLMPALLKTFGAGTVSIWSKERRGKIMPAPAAPADDDLDEKLHYSKQVTDVSFPAHDPDVNGSTGKAKVQGPNGSDLAQQTSKRGSLLHDFQKRRRKQAKENSGSSPIMESLADIIQAVA